MLHRNQLTKFADQDDVDAKTVERDYVLTQVMAGIARQPGHERMAFKGGTALRLCYFADYRYSADLDFSLTDGMTNAEAVDLVADAIGEVKERIQLRQLALSDDGTRIHYVGPLASKVRDVKLDLADAELVVNTHRVPLLSRYDDQPPATVIAYTLDEIAAEKLRCVMQRMQARDLYDLHELFVHRGLHPDEVWPDFEAKARHKGKDPDRFDEVFDKRVPSWHKVWDQEMETHVPSDARPEFQAIERAVRRALRQRR